MQELRFVLIVVGALAIMALLFHGLWTSKKEGKAKFGDKPLSKLDLGESEPKESEMYVAPEDDYEIIRKERKEPAFEDEKPFSTSGVIGDPLIDDLHSGQDKENKFSQPKFDDDITVAEAEAAASIEQDALAWVEQPQEIDEPLTHHPDEIDAFSGEETIVELDEPTSQTVEPELQVIVLNVHCAGDSPFVGTKLFDSMQQNGLVYGEMDIFHRHLDMSGTGKVLFSVANMMHPGTLKHDDPAEFSTKGISFFMTLPCYGEADQNFNLMLKTAQKIADDLGGNVLDDKRNLMTPDRLAGYRRQIVEFKAANA
ncbi:cell division protein ZipA [Vibrio vulnificus]|uniref:cell division protein ZipA n=1 Tax=Vibrio vulnificus TaxID=672 RepID=UPI0012F94148|nr:cell division protein ZipA [Vibrio vulnificus]ELK8507456.1 cell division protein ZipA [Vibrio vulnificus]ELK8994037.1 cell division protein ZipA [Vibrio vulnificus]ELS3554517.1 cell division protein ZipA [Vibrio vulnificus]MCJ0805602.1 cell division protein ZipA [Vibrio vulnificus]MCJ0817857.1 cell division protein ZipA [Vibrio vulnificus]